MPGSAPPGARGAGAGGPLEPKPPERHGGAGGAHSKHGQVHCWYLCRLYVALRPWPSSLACTSLGRARCALWFTSDEPRSRERQQELPARATWGSDEWEERDSLNCNVLLGHKSDSAQRLVCLLLQRAWGSSSAGWGSTVAFCFSFCSSSCGDFKETFDSVVLKWDFLNLSFLFQQLCFAGLGLFSVRFQLGK